ncbi:MAG: efflux RND transporter periplasmic adaptor subunit [Acidobacteriia bacterium]|nr:efflux RND transporter periplasmic adaptor subunit [Terriglobia bacterium]
MKKCAGIILFLTLTAAAQWRCSSNGTAVSTGIPGPAPAAELAVKVAPVSVVDWPVTIPISGSLRSQSNVEIKSEVGGRLTATYFEEGDAVHKDQLLAEIDPVNYRLAYDQAAATLAVAQAGLDRIQVTLDHARREKERADNLLRTGGITEKDHQAAVTGVKEAESQARLAQAQIDQARSAVNIADKALKDCRIVAPADGQVRRRYLDRGSLLAPGASVYSLVDNARLELECLVPSYQLSGVRLGQRAAFTTPTWGERRFGGNVSAVNPMVESDNRSVKVIVKIANPGGELRSGMFARGEIEVRIESKAIVIPRSALVVGQEQSSSGRVYVVSGGRALQREVQVGGVRQDQLWIQRGLAEGDQVIVDIGPSLKDGVPVRAIPDRSAGEQ